jgi:hypothetical protein
MENDWMDDWNNRRADRAVSFYSEDIIAISEIDANEAAVPLSRLCANLGLDPDEQIEYLRANPVLAAGLSTLSIDTALGVRREPCLRVDLVPLWLTTLHPNEVDDVVRPKLELFQQESASVLWQAFKPQGFSPADALLAEVHEQSQSDQGYQAQMAMATLARQQMMIERQLNEERSDRDVPREQVVDPQARQMAQAVRVVANNLAMRSRRNEYGGVFQGLYRQFGIASYRDMPRGRFIEAMEWLDRWRGDIEGEPEPPPDI